MGAGGTRRRFIEIHKRQVLLAVAWRAGGVAWYSRGGGGGYRVVLAWRRGGACGARVARGGGIVWCLLFVFLFVSQSHPSRRNGHENAHPSRRNGHENVYNARSSPGHVISPPLRTPSARPRPLRQSLESSFGLPEDGGAQKTGPVQNVMGGSLSVSQQRRQAGISCVCRRVCLHVCDCVSCVCVCICEKELMHLRLAPPCSRRLC